MMTSHKCLIHNSSNGSNVLGSILLGLFALVYYLTTPHHTLILKSLSSLVALLRYRRVERHCDSCEQALVSQLSADNPAAVNCQPQLIGWRLRCFRKLPWRAFSRHWGRLANTRLRPEFLNTLLIWVYAKGFGCNLDEAEHTITEYKVEHSN